MGEEDDVEYFQCCEDGELEQAHVSAVVSADYELAENCRNPGDRATIGARPRGATLEGGQGRTIPLRTALVRQHSHSSFIKRGKNDAHF